MTSSLNSATNGSNCSYPTPSSDSAIPSTSNITPPAHSSITIQSVPAELQREPTSWYSRAVNWVWNSTNHFFAAMRANDNFLISSGNSINPKELKGETLFQTLDALIANPRKFAAAIGIKVAPAQQQESINITVEVRDDQIPLFAALCFLQNHRIILEDQSYFIITSEVIQYVLKTPGLDLTAKSRRGWLIFNYLCSKEVFKLLLDHSPDLIKLEDARGETVLFYTTNILSSSLENRIIYEMINILFFADVDLNQKNSFGKTVLNTCKSRLILQYLAACIHLNPHFLREDQLFPFQAIIHSRRIGGVICASKNETITCPK